MGLTQVVNPVQQNQSVGVQNPALTLDKQGAQLASELHGKWYNAAYNGGLFQAATAAAGTTIPVSTTTGATFAIYNPIGSGKVVELVRYNAVLLNATAVVGGIGLGIATGLTLAPTGLTVAPSSGAAYLGGSGTAVCQVYTVATIVATTRYHWMGIGYGATSGAFGGLQYDFDGQILLYPGSLAHVVGTAAQTSASAQSITWAEWTA